GHLDALLKLSDMVPRSEVPAINAAIIRGERDYKGSAEAAALVFQALEASMEFARVIVPGGAQGDANTREEARKAVSVSLNVAQMKTVVEQMRQNAHRNVEANRAKEKDLARSISNIGGSDQAPPLAPPPVTTDPNDRLGILPKPKATADAK